MSHLALPGALTLLLAATGPPTTAPVVPATSELRFTELADGAIVATSQPYGANSLLVRTASGTVILVDTPTTPRDTVELLEWTRARWGKDPSFAVNSHWHADATGGNQVLRERGVEVISSARTAALLRERGAAMRETLIESFAERDPATRAELDDLRPTPANHVVRVDERVVLELGGETVWLVYPGPSHSEDSLGVYFPERGLLYGGCAVRSDGKFVNRTEADFGNWAIAVEKLAALRPRVVVPGHGTRFDPAMLGETVDAARRIAAARQD